MIVIQPENPDLATMSTPHILSVIEKHASTTALILLPGVQYYTGQFLDIEQITAKAHAHGILIGWDLAHAVGNVILELDKWDIDFAAWCNYKYVNSGPGAIAGLFVNPKHGKVDLSEQGEGFRNRLSGWWGGDKAIRFEMGRGTSKALVGMGPFWTPLLMVTIAQTLSPYQGLLASKLAILQPLLSQP